MRIILMIVINVILFSVKDLLSLLIFYGTCNVHMLLNGMGLSCWHMMSIIRSLILTCILMGLFLLFFTSFIWRFRWMFALICLDLIEILLCIACLLITGILGCLRLSILQHLFDFLDPTSSNSLTNQKKLLLPTVW